MSRLKDMLHSRVIIENSRGSRYAGLLVGFRNNEQKFCLSNLAIINRAGHYIVSGSKQSRWFSVDKFNVKPEDKVIL